MLKKLKVRNFKGFKDELFFDLSNPGNYEFNTKALNEGVVNTALVYGHNGCGKSNLGLAIFDLVLHLTDKEKLFKNYFVYKNLDSLEEDVSFEYIFEFLGKEAIYHYKKKDAQILVCEDLFIDNEHVLSYNFINNKGFCRLKGAENLQLEPSDNKLSKLKYIKNNTILENNEINKAFLEMMDFIDNMLLFYALDERGYQGFTLGVENIDDVIIKSGKLSEFEEFLHKAEIHEKLVPMDVNGMKQIYCKYDGGYAPFQLVASSGTKALELFFFWYVKMTEASLVFIDEFDAFYHHELAVMLVKKLVDMQETQVILTSHNTDLISNDILRPDCYYYMNAHSIKPISELSKGKELRRAHNIQKMYKAGAFSE